MTPSTLTTMTVAAPPFSRAVQRVVAGCLVLAGLLNGGLQYLDYLVIGDGERAEIISSGLEQHSLYQALWFGVWLSSIFLLIGFLGLAQITRWRTPRLTAVATVLTVWGMWGFGNVLAGTYIGQVVAPKVLDVNSAVTLIDDGFLKDWGMIAGSLVPHLLGSFFGILLLAIACWRSGLPRVAALLLIGFLVWDFALTPIGPVEPHLLLMIALGWLGVAVAKMPHERWLGQ